MGTKFQRFDYSTQEILQSHGKKVHVSIRGGLSSLDGSKILPFCGPRVDSMSGLLHAFSSSPFFAFVVW